MDSTTANLYLGSWNGKSGKMWWDDLSVEEIGLVNVLRRPGCPVAVRSEQGTACEEGRDFDPMHNAVEHFYAVSGSLAGSRKGLDKDDAMDVCAKHAWGGPAD